MPFNKGEAHNTSYDPAICQRESSLGLDKTLMGAISYSVGLSIQTWWILFSYTPHSIGMLFNKSDA